MSDFATTFKGLMQHLRNCGHVCPFVLNGRHLRAVGYASPKQLACRHDNENKSEAA